MNHAWNAQSSCVYFLGTVLVVAKDGRRVLRVEEKYLTIVYENVKYHIKITHIGTVQLKGTVS
jgi:hypothetical protein